MAKLKYDKTVKFTPPRPKTASRVSILPKNRNEANQIQKYCFSHGIYWCSTKKTMHEYPLSNYITVDFDCKWMANHWDLRADCKPISFQELKKLLGEE